MGTTPDAHVQPPTSLEHHVNDAVERPLGQQLLAAGLIGEAQLAEGLAIHRNTGVLLGEALISLGYARADHVGEIVARQQRIEHFGSQHVQAPIHWPIPTGDSWYREHRVVPILGSDGTLRAVANTSHVRSYSEHLAERLGCPVLPVLATNRDVEQLLHNAHREEDIRRSAYRLREEAPESSADIVLTRSQRHVLLGGATLLVLALLWDWSFTLTAFVSFVTLLYMASSLYMLVLTIAGWGTRAALPFLGAVAESDDVELPIYTILVPLYHEAEVIPQLARAIQALSWPKAKLDVRLLLEEDDLTTIQAAREAQLPSYFTFVIVPKDGPRGKPKACNYGLAHAQGEFVVIFDAEDIPEPDQLRKVYATFRANGPDLVCVQCRLNFYNPEQNLLTRWFTAEYSMWFDLLLPGLQRVGAPIPLGGTSNHFRRTELEEIGAWDPYNVTEDADLGIRLAKWQWRTVVIDSTTYEEANPQVGNWIRQRSRWIKGYAQTWFVHMRHPFDLWRVLGTRGFLGFQCFVGGRVLVLLLNPIYWSLNVLWYFVHSQFISQIFPAPIFYLGLLSLYCGNIAFLYFGMAGVIARRHYRLVKYTLIAPAYWVLMSIAAWKGVLQLISRPHYWEKTRHGLATATSLDPTLTAITPSAVTMHDIAEVVLREERS